MYPAWYILSTTGSGSVPPRSPLAEVGHRFLSPARRSAAVRMGRGGTARPPETEWNSGVAAFLGGVTTYNQDIFKYPIKRHDNVS